MTRRRRGERLENDATAAVEWAGGRPSASLPQPDGGHALGPQVEVEIRRHFDSPKAPVRELSVEFPRVFTAFRHPSGGAVTVHPVRARLEIVPNAGDVPYPEGEPGVRIHILDRGDLDPEAQPFLPGLHWSRGGEGRLPPELRELLDRLASASGRSGSPDMERQLFGGLEEPDPVGHACLWRRWDPRWSLVFVIRQAWALLTMGISSSPGDTPNHEAAAWWARQRELAVPLQPALPGLVSVEHEEPPPRRSIFGPPREEPS